MSVDHRVALDANCVTFFMEAMWDDYDPAQDKSDLAAERSAILKAWLFTGFAYTLLPAAEAEYMRIRNKERLEAHHAVAGALMLDVADPISQDLVSVRVSELLPLHSGEADCRTLAEAELVPVATLLSFDKRMITHLQNQSRVVAILTPSQYLIALALAPDAKPVLQPMPANPLSQKSWWRFLT